MNPLQKLKALTLVLLLCVSAGTIVISMGLLLHANPMVALRIFVAALIFVVTLCYMLGDKS